MKRMPDVYDLLAFLLGTYYSAFLPTCAKHTRGLLSRQDCCFGLIKELGLFQCAGNEACMIKLSVELLQGSEFVAQLIDP